MIRLAWLGAGAALALLVLACAGPPRPRDSVAARADLLRDGRRQVVADAARRAALAPRVDALEAALLEVLEENARRNQAFVAANSDPATGRARLETLAQEIAAARRAGLQRVLSERVAVRREMTADEWRAFVGYLQAFDEARS